MFFSIRLQDLLRSNLDKVKNPSKMLAGCVLSVFDRVAKSVYSVLKNYNDPKNADMIPNLYVPSPLFEAGIKPILKGLSTRTFKLNEYLVFAITTEDALRTLLPAEYLTATWDDVTTTVLASAGYPFNVRCSKSSQNIKCIFVANARHKNGEMVLKYDQNMR